MHAVWFDACHVYGAALDDVGFDLMMMKAACQLFAANWLGQRVFFKMFGERPYTRYGSQNASVMACATFRQHQAHAYMERASYNENTISLSTGCTGRELNNGESKRKP